MVTKRSDREIAVEALRLFGDLLSTFTDKGDIGAIANVLRSTWQDKSTMKWRWEALNRLTDELASVVPDHCSWCPNPAAPDPHCHRDGQVHREVADARPVFGSPCCIDPACPLAGLQHGHGAAFIL